MEKKAKTWRLRHRRSDGIDEWAWQNELGQAGVTQQKDKALTFKSRREAENWGAAKMWWRGGPHQGANYMAEEE